MYQQENECPGREVGILEAGMMLQQFNQPRPDQVLPSVPVFISRRPPRLQ